MSVGVDDIASVCEFVLALSKQDGWLFTDIPVTVEQPDFQPIPGLPANSEDLRFAGQVPLLVDDVWISAGLLNRADFDGDVAAVYRDTDTQEIAVKTWSERYPNDTEDGTPNSMPRANIAANWGDFVFLGDIEYRVDPTEPFGPDNSARFPHGIWRSVAGTTDRWNPDDVFFVSQRQEQNDILGMFPTTRGLIVVTQSTVALLRGSPDDFAFEELRAGISPASRSEVTYWPYAGLVVWLDRFGRVWGTNGDDVARLDRGVTIDRRGPGALVGVDESLFVSGQADVRVLHSFGEAGGWSTLNTPVGWRQATFCRGTVIGVSAELDGSVEATSNVVQVFALFEEGRGIFNGVPVRSRLRTRPLPGASDRTVFWHRFGVRANGPGRLRSATSYASADVSERGLRHRVFGRLSERKDFTFPAHGPSLEAVFEFEFEGDVTPEHLTVAAHRGRSER